MKSCLKSAGCVYLGETKKLHQNSRTGGKDISMNVTLISTGSFGTMNAAGLFAMFSKVH